jgi:hypothetical protein
MLGIIGITQFPDPERFLPERSSLLNKILHPQVCTVLRVRIHSRSFRCCKETFPAKRVLKVSENKYGSDYIPGCGWWQVCFAFTYLEWKWILYFIYIFIFTYTYMCKPMCKHITKNYCWKNQNHWYKIIASFVRPQNMRAQRRYSQRQSPGSSIPDFIKDDSFVLISCQSGSHDLDKEICSLIGLHFCLCLGRASFYFIK